MSPPILPDELIERYILNLDKRDALDKELRALLLEGYAYKETSKSPDIRGVKWSIKGGAEAGPLDNFAFCFASNQDGTIPAEKKPLVDFLKVNKELKTGEYTITASKDFKFLQRKREAA